MYKIADMIRLGGESLAAETWQDKVACQRVNSSHVIIGEGFEGMAVFSYILLRRGSLSVRYDGQIIDFRQGDLYICAPGIPLENVAVSDDYEALLLAIDEQLVYDNPHFRHLVRASYLPVSEQNQPKLSPGASQAEELAYLMQSIRRHIISPASSLQGDAILALCQVFSIDLINCQNIQIEGQHHASRAEELFTAFLRLVPAHFIEHHDLTFYADQLCITTTYLSRIARQMSGRSASEFIYHALAVEATIRLKTTNRSITQLADDFHFSDQAAFTKFFTRMKGISPKEFRKGK